MKTHALLKNPKSTRGPLPKMPNRNNRYFSGILLGAAGVVLFSTKAVLVKLAYTYNIGTLELLLFRMLFSVPFYVLLIAWLGKQQGATVDGRDYFWLVVFGFLGYYLASYFDFLGLNYITAGLERIILFIYPTVVAILSWSFFGKKLNKAQLLAIGTSYVGVFVTFSGEIETSGPKTLWGGFLVLLSAISYAGYLVGSGWLIPKFGVLRFTSYAMIVSTCCVMGHYAAMGDRDLWNYPVEVYVYAVGMAIFSTLIPSFLVSKSIDLLGANTFSILGSLGPVSTIVLAYVFLGERLAAVQLAGIAIVLCGITVLSIKGRPKENR